MISPLLKTDILKDSDVLSFKICEFENIETFDINSVEIHSMREMFQLSSRYILIIDIMKYIKNSRYIPHPTIPSQKQERILTISKSSRPEIFLIKTRESRSENLYIPSLEVSRKMERAFLDKETIEQKCSFNEKFNKWTPEF